MQIDPIVATLLGFCATLVGGIITYLLGVVNKQAKQIEDNNTALAASNKASAEIAATVPAVLKEAQEWKQRYEALAQGRQ